MRAVDQLSQWVDGKEVRQSLVVTLTCKLWSTAARLFSFVYLDLYCK
jgi:hypothetical protein